MPTYPDLLPTTPTTRLVDELRRRGCAVALWYPEDVQALRPEWSRSECVHALERVHKYLQDELARLGAEALDTLLETADATPTEV